MIMSGYVSLCIDRKIKCCSSAIKKRKRERIIPACAILSDSRSLPHTEKIYALLRLYTIAHVVLQTMRVYILVGLLSLLENSCTVV